ncbi:MAG: hypothetical protein GC146_09280 [Limimaricola sp.]|uniref:hypothetical protein n=1 Tax=Limimaricola sp. TaxID=2211665 RepID=UPI001D99946C|nr:hypothetical protein [Limimaricola sp.]MBI1417402.1 hypothetical protein [Limimaricola sp.]
MRDFFIRSFEMLISVILALIALGILLFAGFVAFGQPGGMQGMGPMGGMGPMAQGPLAGLLILIGGGLYLIFIGGLMYLGLGIYHNTRRTADAIERMAGQR